MSFASLLSPLTGLPTLVLILLFITTAFAKDRVKRPGMLAGAWRMMLLSLAVGMTGVILAAIMSSSDGMKLAMWATIISSVLALVTLLRLVQVMIDFDLVAPSTGSSDAS